MPKSPHSLKVSSPLPYTHSHLPCERVDAKKKVNIKRFPLTDCWISSVQVLPGSCLLFCHFMIEHNCHNRCSIHLWANVRKVAAKQTIVSAQFQCSYVCACLCVCVHSRQQRSTFLFIYFSLVFVRSGYTAPETSLHRSVWLTHLKSGSLDQAAHLRIVKWTLYFSAS